MKVDENKQLQTTGDIQKWSSENNFIASVSPTGIEVGLGVRPTAIAKMFVEEGVDAVILTAG